MKAVSDSLHRPSEEEKKEKFVFQKKRLDKFYFFPYN